MNDQIAEVPATWPQRVLRHYSVVLHGQAVESRSAFTTGEEHSNFLDEMLERWGDRAALSFRETDEVLVP